MSLVEIRRAGDIRSRNLLAANKLDGLGETPLVHNNEPRRKHQREAPWSNPNERKTDLAAASSHEAKERLVASDMEKGNRLGDFG